MTTATVTPSMQRKADALAAQVPLFSRGRSKKTGESFVIVPGSTEGVAHWTTARGCTCIGFQKRGTCTHQLAVAASQAPRQTCLRKGCENPTEGRTRLCRPCLIRQRELLANA